MSKRRVYVGIDNGALSGAMCALCPETGAVIEYALMPNIEHDGKKEADPVELIRWLSGYDCIAIGIEACPKHAGSAASMRSMSMSFGICHGAMMVAQLPVCRVTVHEWQKKILGKVPQGKTKDYALRKATENWPGEKWLPSPRCRTPHGGFIDAALIATYVRDLLGGPATSS